MRGGWICLHRALQDHWIFQESDGLKLWIHLLLNANHKDRQTTFNTVMVTVKRGQVITGRFALSERLNITEAKIRRYLELLEKDHMINQQKNNKYSLITIINYEDYQNTNQQTASRSPADQPAESPAEYDKNNQQNNEIKPLLSIVSKSEEKNSTSRTPAEHQQNDQQGKPISTTLEQVNNTTIKTSSPAKPKKAEKVIDPEDMRFAQKMFARILKVAPKTKPPNLDKWADVIRLAREQDNLSHHELWAVFDWANKDSFWSVNILSPQTLRDKFSQLDAKRLSHGEKGRGYPEQRRESTVSRASRIANEHKRRLQAELDALGNGDGSVMGTDE